MSRRILILFFITMLCVLPISAYAETNTITIESYSYDTITFTYSEGFELIICKHAKGTYTANNSIYVFISNITGANYYITNEEIPSYALWIAANKSTASWNLDIPEGQVGYLVFINNQSDATQVTYTKPCGEGIPGFGYEVTIMLLMVLLGLVSLKKMRKIELIR